MTEVTKMRSPQTTGEDQPVPGMSVFQATFSVVLQVSGSLGFSVTPVDSGPRNWGHWSIVAADRDTAKDSVRRLLVIGRDYSTWERRSPDWRLDQRQSGDWRSRALQ